MIFGKISLRSLNEKYVDNKMLGSSTFRRNLVNTILDLLKILKNLSSLGTALTLLEFCTDPPWSKGSSSIGTDL